MSKIHNVVIIGGGCAGLTASIYASRSLLEPILITGYEQGGQLMTTTDVENFPGFPDGITGPELIKNMELQAKRFGTIFVNEQVTRIEHTQKSFGTLFLVYMDNGECIQTRSVIVATGASALWLNLEFEDKLRAKGFISSCAVCDGAFHKDEHLLVIGGGDSALEEAIFLTRYASTVTIVHRREEFRASKIMLERARTNPKIEWITSATVKKWLLTTRGDMRGVLLSTPDGEKEIECQGVFIAIGHRPNTGFLEGLVELDKEGYIVPHKNSMTNIPGLFYAGDAADHRYRQAISASASGCMASMDCEKWLENRSLKL